MRVNGEGGGAWDNADGGTAEYAAGSGALAEGVLLGRIELLGSVCVRSGDARAALPLGAALARITQSSVRGDRGETEEIF